MKVYVKNQRGKWLMPTHPAKARWLVRTGKANVVQRTPFAIQLTYAVTNHTQPVVVGIDDGGITAGVAAVANNTALHQEEVRLRTDIKAKLDARRSYRRGRRFRKTRYRQARFNNRASARKAGRIPPSIRAKKEAIWRAVKNLPLPAPTLIRLEKVYFDFQAIEDPNITGAEYPQGALLYAKNFNSACKTRDKHRCRVCKSKKKLQVHHLTPRTQGGSDKLSNLMTLCKDCHETHHATGLKLPKPKDIAYRSAAHVQRYLRKRLETIAPVRTTFGYITAHFRKQHGIDRTYANDALVIAQPGVMPTESVVKTFCLGGRKRSLHEATPRKGRKEPNREQKRNGKNVVSLKGFKRLDTVIYQGQVGYISGFNGTTMAFVRGSDGRYIVTPGKSYKQVPLSQVQYRHHNQTCVKFLVKEAANATPTPPPPPAYH